MRSQIVGFMVSLLCAGFAHATVFSIGPNGAYPSLSAAINVAVLNPDDHEFRLQPGTYVGEYTFNISGAKTWLISGGWNEDFTSNPVAPTATVLQANPLYTVFRPSLTDTAQLQIRNLTVTGGMAIFEGGGIDAFTSLNSNLFLQDCRITGNQTFGNGGGLKVIASDSSAVGISRCEITNNSVEGVGGKYGAGAFVRLTQSASLSIANSSINLNQDTASSTVGAGIGLYVDGFDDSNILILDSVIEENTSQATSSSGSGAFFNMASAANFSAEGLRMEGNEAPNASAGSRTQIAASLTENARFTLRNSLIVNSNSAGLQVQHSGTGNTTISSNTFANHLRTGVSVGATAGTHAITNNIVHNNNGMTFGLSSDPIVFRSNNLGDDVGGVNNLNPLFVNASSDFHLQSNSPAINAGSNAFNTTLSDFELNPRVVNGTIDIGAYEYQFPPSDFLFGSGFENTP